MNPEAAKALVHYLSESLHADAAKRKAAENELTKRGSEPGFPALLLQLLAHQDVPLNIRQAGAILFKNTVKMHWAAKDGPSISDQDKAQIKAVIVDLMLSVPPVIQKQLSAALELISAADFPSHWQDLLPNLVKKFESKDFQIINGVIATVNSILKRYRHMMKAPDVLQELKYILEILQAPLLQLAQYTSSLVDTTTDRAALQQLFSVTRYILKIFNSLNSIDLPEYFEDHMNDWMTLFRKFLLYTSTAPELVSDSDEEPGLLHEVQTAICANIQLYIGKYEEEFTPFLQTFVKDVWTLLLSLGPQAKYDSLVASSISFLGSVSTSVHFALFKDAETLTMLCDKIVLPNMRLREVDVELFEDNPLEYLRRDIEGSDSDTRRRSATELVKGLRKHFEAEVTQVCSTYINTMLQQYAANPKANWQAKDVAIYLVTALAVRSATAQQGTTSVNQLVPIMDFFASQVLPELQSTTSPHPILKADALKFVSTFRQQFPRETFGSTLLPLLVQHLVWPDFVVHTYAAVAIDRFLLLKDKVSDAPGAPSVSRYGKAEIKALLPALLTSLFKTLDLPGSKENDYIMRAVMRVLSTATDDIVPVSSDVMAQLVKVLTRVAPNPTNPGFNHFLFESLAAVVRFAGNPQTVASFEQLLFPPFGEILNRDVQELSPYVFQILALLLELNPTAGLSPSYVSILPALVMPVLWERSGNVPGLVRLLQAYLRKGPRQIASSPQLSAIFGVFQKLISTKLHDHEGFYLLEAIVEKMTMAELSQYLPVVFSLIFSRLSPEHRTQKFLRSFLVFLSLFVDVHGAAAVLAVVEQIQPGLFANLLESLWVPNIQKVNGQIERKMAALAMAKLITEPKFIGEPRFFALWGRLLALTLELLELSEEESAARADAAAIAAGGPTAAAAADGDEEIDIEDVSGYSNVYSQLANAPKLDSDPFKEVDAKKFVAVGLHELCKANPGKFGPLISSALPPPAQAILQQYFAAAGVPQPYIV